MNHPACSNRFAWKAFIFQGYVRRLQDFNLPGGL